MLYVPVAFLLCCTFTSLVQSAMGYMAAVQAYGFFGTIPATATTAAISSIPPRLPQLVFAVLLMVLGLIVAVNCLKSSSARRLAPCLMRSPSGPEMGKATVRSRRCLSSPCVRGRQAGDWTG